MNWRKNVVYSKWRARLISCLPLFCCQKIVHLRKFVIICKCKINVLLRQLQTTPLFFFTSLLQYYSSGIFELHESRVLRDRNKRTDTQLHPVELTDVVQVLSIIPVGIIPAILLLTCESVFNCLTSSKSRNIKS